jgi:epoxyqueuosine reductase
MVDAKKLIVDVAAQMGFHRVVVGSLAPLEREREIFEQWLANGYASGMRWLERNQLLRTSPQLLSPGSRSAIIVSVSYFTERPKLPDHAYGRVALYAVGLDYHAVLRGKLRELKSRIESSLGRPLLGKAYTDDVALYEQAFASRHGLGFKGKNTMIIGPKLSGSYYFVAELFTDLELEPDEPYPGTCGNCFRCGDKCPTKAIVEPGTLDAGKCISYLTIENKEGIPEELRRSMGDWLFGCDVCQEVCPYNRQPGESPWPEFSADKGAGHYIDLISLLSDCDDDRFAQLFAHTPLRRPKLRGLLRNALVVAGNHLAGATTYAPSPKQRRLLVEAVNKLAAKTTDPMLKEHAVWALA